MKLIVGLGNPGEKYLHTRHNLGFRIIDQYIQNSLPVEQSDKFWQTEKKFNALIGKLDQNIFTKPQTFMNLSGQSVVAIAKYYKIAVEDIIIVYDELDIPLGQIKIRQGGAAAGHHGVESIIEQLSNDKFIRVRVGIGNTKSAANPSFEADKYVVGEFDSSEKNKVKQVTKKAILALETLLKEGIETAQNTYN